MTQNQFTELVQLIKQSRTNAINAVNSELINLYWNIGGYILKKLSSASWGEKTVNELAVFIQTNHPELKGYTRRSLYKMKLFYESYSLDNLQPNIYENIQLFENKTDIIVPSLMAQFEPEDIKNSILTRISWTHHLTIISRTKTREERDFYLKLCIKENYSVRQLERQINSGVFERVMLGNAKNLPVNQEAYKELNHAFKDTYVFEFLNLPEPHNETELQ